MTGADFEEGLRAHALERGFRCVVARTRDQLVGFAYGFTCSWDRPPNGWYAMLVEALGPDATRRWIRDRFEFPWFGVRPSRQGEGIGGALHQALLSGISDARAWLVTEERDEPVRRFYRARGWQELAIDGFGTEVPRVVLGLDLHSEG